MRRPDGPASERAYWVALATVAGVGARTLTRLLQHFGSLAEVFAASAADLQRVPGVGAQTAAAITAIDLPTVEARMSAWAASGIQTLTWQDAGYPPNLLRTPDAPPVLFVRGALLPADSRAVAVVGTRQPARASAALAAQTGRELARRGWAVVSGLALGIDAAAHRGALEGGGRTLAVLGSGVGRVYPRRNAGLAAEVEAQGALLSEAPPTAGVSRQTLIARNRITSGLSRAVIVVQASADSGSVNTAKWARQQRRTVLAVAGEAAGNEALLADGAAPITPPVDWDALSAQLDAAEIEPVPAGDDPLQPRLF